MSTGDPENENPTVNGLPRLFVFEPGWRITRKVGSEREFCYVMAPGKDYYHRLADGEIYLLKAEEKLCLPCAARRGLISYDPKSLREPAIGLNLVIDELADGFDVIIREPDDAPG